MHYLRLGLLVVLCCIGLHSAVSQINTNPDNGYEFEIEKQLDATPVENQYHTGTCWSFSALSFLESELYRQGVEPFNLSEMFIVWHTYADKGRKYVRMHGNLKFGQGGAFHDVTYVTKKYGLVPESAYPGDPKPEHGELEAVLRGMLNGVIKNEDGQLTEHWYDAYKSTLDSYLGEIPDTFQYQGQAYTPQSLADSFPINADNYVELTSFTHHPFYEKFVLEVPDNWQWRKMYNIPLNDLKRTLRHAIDNGYSIAWASDVSDPGFSYKNCVAVEPKVDWSKYETERAKDSVAGIPMAQRNITQEMRQKAFDNYSVTDDHGMHITGIAKDQNDTRYYIVKNSWGTKHNECDGYLYASEEYVLLHTTDIMVHKEALPNDVAKKLGLNAPSN